jgi:hypothetical protein
MNYVRGEGAIGEPEKKSFVRNGFSLSERNRVSRDFDPDMGQNHMIAFIENLVP